MKTSETLMQMEAAIKKYTSEVFLTEDDLYDADKKQPPRFVTQIKDQTTLVEMQSTKFECQLAPVGDPNMKVEWFFNGKPLHHSECNTFFPLINQCVTELSHHLLHHFSFASYRESIRANLRLWLRCNELWMGLSRR